MIYVKKSFIKQRRCDGANRIGLKTLKQKLLRYTDGIVGNGIDNIATDIVEDIDDIDDISNYVENSNNTGQRASIGH